MRAVEVPAAGADFEIVERDIPEPEDTEVRIAVDACGICHSDAVVKEGTRPIEYPRIPGHEVVGSVDAIGGEVTEWRVGDHVGVGWHGGHCYTCEACCRGDFKNCDRTLVTGLDFDGGYAEYLTAPREALAAVPEDLDAVDAAPLLCAGITTFNGLRNSDGRLGDLVAVQGIGGLGHLGIQYAHRAGFETVALSRGSDKREAAYELGADHYINTEAEDPAEALQDLGGADVILTTVPSSEAIESVVGGLGDNGDLIAVGIPGDPVEVNIQELIGSRSSVSGWASGTAIDSQDTLKFSALRDVTPEIETFDLEDVGEAYERMMSNEVRFRAVLVP